MLEYYKRNFDKRSFDPLNSTFVWKIHLDPQKWYGGNKQEDKILYGYTKNVGTPERKDKTELLINRIRAAILRHGYHLRSEKIHVCFNKKGVKEEDEHLFTIYPEECRISRRFWQQDIFNPDDVKFFIAKEVYPALGDKAFTHDGKTLDATKFQFFNEHEFAMTLVDICYEGYTKKQVQKFVNQYFDLRIQNNLKKPPHRRKK